MNEELSQSYKDFYEVPLGEHAARHKADLLNFMHLVRAPIEWLGAMEIPDAMLEILPFETHCRVKIMTLQTKKEERIFLNRFIGSWRSLQTGLVRLERHNFDTIMGAQFFNYLDDGWVINMAVNDIVTVLKIAYCHYATPRLCYELGGVAFSEIERAASDGMMGVFSRCDKSEEVRDAILSGVAHNERATVERLEKVVAAKSKALKDQKHAHKSKHSARGQKVGKINV